MGFIVLQAYNQVCIQGKGMSERYQFEIWCQISIRQFDLLDIFVSNAAF